MSAPRDIVFFGVSNLLSDLIDCALALGHRIACIVLNQAPVVRPRTLELKDRLKRLGLDVPLVMADDFSPAAETLFALGTTAPGRGALVEFCQKRWALQFATLVHPSACLSPFASTGEGVFVGAGSIIAPGVRLGAFAFVNRGVTIGHDTVIGDYARMMPGCNVGGHVKVGHGAMIGMGANVMPELEVGDGAVVAAGAAVIADVDASTLVAGVPATVRKRISAGN
jgi:sugar O-acyltransferase (sialic acid O-acetyltransferase NeuD family)